jgi:hypothetical protein
LTDQQRFISQASTKPGNTLEGWCVAQRAGHSTGQFSVKLACYCVQQEKICIWDNIRKGTEMLPTGTPLTLTNINVSHIYERTLQIPCVVRLPFFLSQLWQLILFVDKIIFMIFCWHRVWYKQHCSHTWASLSSNPQCHIPEDGKS